MARLPIAIHKINIATNLATGGTIEPADIRTVLTDVADSGHLTRTDVHYWQSSEATPDFPGTATTSRISVIPRTGMYHIRFPAYSGSSGTRRIHFMTETQPGVAIFWNYIRYFEIGVSTGALVPSTDRFNDRFDLTSTPQRAYYHSDVLTSHKVLNVLISTRRFSIYEHA